MSTATIEPIAATPADACTGAGVPNPQGKPYTSAQLGTKVYPSAATPVTLTPLQAAWAHFARDIHAQRPRDLRLSNSPAALTERVVDIEAQVLIFSTWIGALVEDTAQNIALADRADLIRSIESHLLDMASELRASMLCAIERNAA